MSSLPITEAFSKYLMDERHFSPYTARCYGADLRQFVEFLAAQGGAAIDAAKEAEALKQRENAVAANGGRKPQGGAVAGSIPGSLTKTIMCANADLIRAFLAHLGEQHYSAATMARKIATLRSFFKWADRRGLADTNPMTLIRTPRQGKRLPKSITIEQIEKLLAAPDDKEVLGMRDRAMLETLYSTGIRVSELVGLEIDDIDMAGEAVKVKGKGKKERVVPLGAHAMAAVRKYVEMLKADGRLLSAWADGRSVKPLFVNKHGGRLSSRSVRRKLDKYLKQVGLDPTISPHTLRHSFGPAERAGAPGAPEPQHDPGVHAPDHAAHAERVQPGAPASRGGLNERPMAMSNGPRLCAAARCVLGPASVPVGADLGALEIDALEAATGEAAVGTAGRGAGRRHRLDRRGVVRDGRRTPRGLVRVAARVHIAVRAHDHR
jgi:integrase/recombinase XerC